MSIVNPDIVKRVFDGGHFEKFKMVASFLVTTHLSNSIQFLGSENVCLDTKIVIVAHLLAEIWKNKFSVAAILKNPKWPP